MPGNPILGEGKPCNQNHAIVFTRGGLLGAHDMNMDSFFEQVRVIMVREEEQQQEEWMPPPSSIQLQGHICPSHGVMVGHLCLPSLVCLVIHPGLETAERLRALRKP